jgi:hypothetical protein
MGFKSSARDKLTINHASIPLPLPYLDTKMSIFYHFGFGILDLGV